MARRGWPVWTAIFGLLVSTLLLGACARPIASSLMPGAGADAGGSASPGAGPLRPPTSQLLEAYGRLPLHFEENQGQAWSAVRFLARTEGGAVWLTLDGLALGVDGGAVGLKFIGARPAPRLEAREALPGRVNYYRGPDPTRWRTDIPTYRRVRYAGVYPGIDVVVYGNQRQLEYDFVIAPGADPGRVRVRVDGADALALDTAGDLRIRRGGQTIVQRAPVIYQERDGRREPVTGRHVLRGTDLGFEVGPYDRSRPLVIDPVIAYSARIGLGTARAIAVDSAGYAYWAGENTGAFGNEYPLVNPAFTRETGLSEIFVTKLNPNGDSLVYSTYIGTSGRDFVHGIATDGAGNAYIAGLTHTGFPVTPGAFQTTTEGGGEDSSTSFVAKFGPTGALVYGTYLQGTTFDHPEDPIRGDVCYQGHANGIAVDSAGHAYVVGSTSTNNFPTTPGAYIPTKPTVGVRCLTYPSGYLTKLSPDGSSLVYSTYLDGNGAGLSLAVDSAGNAYVGGTAAPPSAPPGTLTATLAASGATTGYYVAKFNATGFPTQTTVIGASPESIAVGPDASIYAAGGNPIDFKTVNAFQPAPGGGADGFAARLKSDGSTYEWSTYVGGSGNDAITAIAAASDGSAWLTGHTQSADFPTKYPTRVKANTVEAVVMKLSDAGALVFSTFLGDGHGYGVAIDPADSVYVAGDAGPDFTPTTPGAYSATPSGGYDVFVLKYFADTTAPVVNITQPGSGAWTGSSILVGATATDSGGVGEVQFWGNGSAFATFACGATDCTFTHRWQTGTLPPGAYQVNAVAIDTSGNCTVSPTIVIYKDAKTPVKPSGASCGGGASPDPTPPTVAITSPVGGATVSGTITVNATASDNVGVASVQFKLDGADLGAADTTSPYSVSWNTTTAPNGSHTLTAVAKDAAGNTTASAPVTVTVSNPPPSGGDTTPPTVSITAPSNGTWTGNSIGVKASATDNVGLASLKVYGNGGVILQVTCTGTSCTLDSRWTTGALAPGAYEMKAVATDTAGNCTVSAAVTIYKDAKTPVHASGAPSCGGGGGGDTTAPSVAISSPAGGSTVSGTVTVSASASDNVGVASVQFKLDGGDLGAVDTTAPYAVPWNTTTASNGSHTLTAVAKDAAGNTTTSAPVTVTVSNPPPSGGDTTPPAVAITSPSNGAWTGNSIKVVASGSDNVGLATLKFYGNGVQFAQTSCGGSTTCSGTHWWSTGSLPPGKHTLTVVAADTAGHETTSAPVTINK